MAEPWKNYSAPAAPEDSGPWSKYAAPATSAPPQVAPAAASPAPQKGFMETAAEGFSPQMDVAKGVIKGAAGTLANVDEAARKHLPAFMTKQWFGFGQPTDIEKEKQFAQPQNIGEKIGKYGEQAGEYLLPGGAEEKAASSLVKAFPQAGKAAAPLARIATKSLGSGVVGAGQGTGFGTGAAIGAVGGALPEVTALVPTKAKAGKVFQSVMEDAKDQPISLTNSMPYLQRVQELGERGATQPRVTQQLFSRAGQENPILYPEARDFASNLSRMSAADRMAINPTMAREVGNASKAFNQDVGAAASAVGRGEDYSRAMRDYARAAALREGTIKAAKAAAKYGLPAAGAGYGLSHLAHVMVPDR